MLEDNGSEHKEGEHYIHGVRFYHVFTIGMEQKLATATSLITSPEITTNPPIIFRFYIEATREPGEEGYNEEYDILAQRMQSNRNLASDMRDTPQAIVTDLFYEMIQIDPNRAIRVDSQIFMCEYEPPMPNINTYEKEGMED